MINIRVKNWTTMTLEEVEKELQAEAQKLLDMICNNAPIESIKYQAKAYEIAWAEYKYKLRIKHSV